MAHGYQNDGSPRKTGQKDGAASEDTLVQAVSHLGDKEARKVFKTFADAVSADVAREILLAAIKSDSICIVQALREGSRAARQGCSVPCRGVPTQSESCRSFACHAVPCHSRAVPQPCRAMRAKRLACQASGVPCRAALPICRAAPCRGSPQLSTLHPVSKLFRTSWTLAVFSHASLLSPQ